MQSVSALPSVCVVAPDQSWPKRFCEEASRVVALFREQDIELHHIGSTAIRGIHAKPVIDILLLASNMEIVDRASAAMVDLGYEAMGEFGIAGRRYFRLNNAEGIRTHQLHAFARGSDDANRHLAFRDYMNRHPSIAEEYNQLKQRLAAQHPNEMAAYMDGKDAFIRLHQSRAVLEAATQ